MPGKLNRAWRIFATGFSFFVFGTGGLILGTLIFPLLGLFTPDPDKRRIRFRALISRCFAFFFWMMHYLGLIRYQVIDRDSARLDQGCLVIANHPSLIDVVALISLYPNACCIVKKALWKNFFLRNVVSNAGYIPNDVPETLLARCEEGLARGDVLIIFPEGTRSVPGKEMTLQRGAAHIAIRLLRPIRFVRIQVNPSMLTKSQSWYSVPSRRADFTITFQERIGTEEYSASYLPPSLAARRLTKKIREAIDINLARTT